MRRVYPKPARFTPKNRHLDGRDVARQHAFYAHSAILDVERSIKAAGIDAVVYSYLESGAKCTCAPSGALLSEEGDLSDDAMADIIGGLEDDDDPSVTLRDDVEVATDLGDVDALFENSFPGRSADEDTGWEAIARSANPSGDADTAQVRVPFAGIHTARCGLCFGSGYVGGFSLFGGHRTMLVPDLDADYGRVAEVDTHLDPYRFVICGSLTLEASVPWRTGTRVMAFRAWDKDDVLGPDVVSLSQTAPDAARPDKLSVTVAPTVADSEIKLSHIEIQTVHSALVPVDIPQVQDEFHPMLESRQPTATVHLPGNVPVNRFSIIVESKYRRAWQVSSITPHLDNHGIAVWREVEARLVGEHELTRLLAGPAS